VRGPHARHARRRGRRERRWNARAGEGGGALFPVSEVERTAIGSVAERICARVGTRARENKRRAAAATAPAGEGEDLFEVNESSASLSHFTTSIYRRPPLIISRVTRIRARTRRPPAPPSADFLAAARVRPARGFAILHPPQAWTDGLLCLNRSSLISQRLR